MYLNNPTVQIKEKQEDQDDIKFAINVKREKFQVEIRKGKRDEILNRKRIERMNEAKKIQDENLKGNYLIQNVQQQVIPLVKQILGQELDLNVKQRMENMINNLNYLNVSEEQKKQLEQNILNPNNPEELLVTFKQYNYLLLQEKIFIADIDQALSQKLLQMLTQLQQFPAIIFEVVNLLIAISSGDRRQVDSIINVGGVTIINNVFNQFDDSLQIQEKLVDVIGNLIGESAINRDLILKSDIIEKILSVQHADIQYTQTAIWAITAICCMRDYNKFCDLKQFQSIFMNIIKTYPNEKQLILDSLISLSILARQATRMDDIEFFCSEQMAQTLQQCLASSSTSIRERALKIIMVLADKKDKQNILNFIQVNKLEQYLFIELEYKHKANKNKKAKQQKQNQNQMQIFNEVKINNSSPASRNLIYDDSSFQSYLLEKYNFFSIIIQAIKKESNDNNIFEGLIIIETFLHDYDNKSFIIDGLLSAQFFEALYFILDFTSHDILKISLQLVYDILSELQYNADSNRMHDDNRFTLTNAIDMVHDTGIFKQIIELQGNRNQSVSEVTQDILDKFFPDLQ